MATVNNFCFTRSLLRILSWLSFCDYKVLLWFKLTAFNEILLRLCVFVGQVQRAYGDCARDMNDMGHDRRGSGGGGWE